MIKKCLQFFFFYDIIENVFTKNTKEVTIRSIMKSKNIRKILIVQLTIIELVLVLLLIDNEQNSCATKENNNLLVYNYNAGTLLAPRTIKEEIEVSTNIIDEDKESKEEVKEEDTDVSTEEVVEEEPVVETTYVPEPVVVNDVNYTVAENLVEYAKQFVGYPYVYGGNSLTNGTDCSGFTKLIYAQYGIDLPRVAYDQSYVGVEVPISNIQIGDLVLSGYSGKTHHVAIYIGNGQIVHALNSNVGIVITDLYIMPITHVRRVL